jgi:DNA-directed RNA polymerase subunit RPC12/RpoP
MATAYCMKCKQKVEIRNPQQITLKNNRPALQGICPVCGNKVFRIGKA